MRRRRLAFPTGKVARPLAVTDESQNAAYFLQPNWNGSIVHLTAHKQSRFQLTRLAARATLPAREGKCALRAQDAHLYKSQFPAEPTGRGAQRQLYLVPNVRNALAVGHADKSQFAALLGSLPGRQGKTACFNPIILYRLSWTSGYICAILKTKTVERGLRLCQK